MTCSYVTQSQSRSPKKAEASPRVPAVERLKRRSRRRHRSSYDAERHICRSNLQVQVDSHDVKENVHANVWKSGERRFFSEKKQYVERKSEEKQVSTILGVYSLRWPATLKVVDHHVVLERLSRTTFEVEIQTFEP